MRHLNRKAHLGRTSSHRRALYANLSKALFTYKRIVTTLPKAKYARTYIERMITFARKGDLSSRRHVLRFITQQDTVKILFDELGPHFKNRNGGYTRIIKLGPRKGDNAEMAMLELVGFDDVQSAEKKTRSKSRMRKSQKEAVESKVERTAAPADSEPEAVKTEAAEEAVDKPADESTTAERAPAAESENKEEKKE